MVYVGNAGSRDVSVLELGEHGEVTPVMRAVVPQPGEPPPSLPLAISPDKRFLYAGVRTEPYAAVTFAIDPTTGKLSLVGTGPLADAMAYIVTDRTGRFLLSASYGGSKVTVNPIGPDGVVRPVQQTIDTLPNGHAILPDAANRFVLHTSLGGDVVYQQKFDANTGMLAANDPPTVGVAQGAGPRHLIFSPDGKMVYLVAELDATVYVFPYDAASGTLKREIQVASALPQGYEGRIWAADLHLTPDGNFLYVSERGSHTLCAFRVDPATGTLTPLDTYPTEKHPRGFGIDPSGRYLLVVGQHSDSMTAYAIDKESGKLTELRKYPIGKGPNWVEIITLP